jgi:transposase
MNVTSMTALEIGKTYHAILSDDGQPALELVVTRGRPRGLSNEQIIAARALRALGRTYADIAAAVSGKDGVRVSGGAVRTALGAR